MTEETKVKEDAQPLEGSKPAKAAERQLDTATAASARPNLGADDTPVEKDKMPGETGAAVEVAPHPGSRVEPKAKPAGGPGKNRLGLVQLDYKGAPSTLCNGCGHDAISAHIIRACFELEVEQHRVAKLSGIGCSSKTPAYFLGRAHGFNSVHGRMPAVATGVALANKDLILVGVSGDGDTASIGLGQFAHMVRRNVPVLYIVENNGVYGLTKGQFSATADRGSKLKSGVVNELPPIDLCALALELGCNFVARSFSGDPKQMVPLLKAALSHRGTAVIDVISPCVTFNEHEGSTKTRELARETEMPLHDLGFIPYYEQISVDYEPGTVREVQLHDGSKILLKKLGEDYDPSDRHAALNMLYKARTERLFLTGIFYVNEGEKDLIELIDLPEAPLAQLPESALRPPREALDAIMASLM